MLRTRGIAWKPTGWFVVTFVKPHPPFITRCLYSRSFGDVIICVGFVFWAIGICFSEAWPFIRKE